MTNNLLHRKVLLASCMLDAVDELWAHVCGPVRIKRSMHVPCHDPNQYHSCPSLVSLSAFPIALALY
jgi:hypothetical protein